MKQTKHMMGMHITIEIVDRGVTDAIFESVFDYFTAVDKTFSPYKKESEISLINSGKVSENNYSDDMREIFQLADQTKQESGGYFDIRHNGKYDPSGLVKGWAIYHAAKLLEKNGYKNYFIDAGGDIQVSGKNAAGNPWRVGIKNPLNSREIIKVIAVTGEGIATSGTAERGKHIYNPHRTKAHTNDIVSLTVIGKNIYEADRFATAAFAMGREGIYFIEAKEGLEGYMIDKQGIATYTNGFANYCL